MSINIPSPRLLTILLAMKPAINPNTIQPMTDMELHSQVFDTAIQPAPNPDATSTARCAKHCASRDPV